MNPIVRPTYEGILEDCVRRHADWDRAQRMVRRHAEFQRRRGIAGAPTAQEVEDFLSEECDDYKFRLAARSGNGGAEANANGSLAERGARF